MGQSTQFLRSSIRYVVGAALCHLLWAGTALAFVPEDRWQATASAPPGTMGDPITLTWSIVPDGTLIQGEGDSQLVSFLDGLFGSEPAGNDLTQRPWFSLLSGSFDRWSQVSGITFAYEPSDDGQIHGSASGLLSTRGDIRLGGAHIDGGSGTLAYSYFPSNSDLVFDTGDSGFFSNVTQNYRAFRNTLMHELGHGLGLDHVVSNTDGFLMEPAINISYDGPQLDDIRGMHWYYGDALEKSNGGLGNDTAELATSLGLISTGGTLSIGTDAALDTLVDSTETDFVSVANSTDADYFSFDVSGPVGLNAVLTPLGGIFNQAVQGSAQTQFNANARSNLALTVYDQDGTTVLALANHTAEGGIESFTGLRLPAAGRYFARVTGSSEIVQLYQLDLAAVALVSATPGDFNFDGEVNAADYGVWRKSLGATGPGLPADANQDQVIDDADYALWMANFGAVAASTTAIVAASVPEPQSIAPLVMACLGLLWRRRARFGHNR